MLENVWRHVEKGEPPREAAIRGTKEITLAVLATTLSLIIIFVPTAFMVFLLGVTSTGEGPPWIVRTPRLPVPATPGVPIESRMPMTAATIETRWIGICTSGQAIVNSSAQKPGSERPDVNTRQC